MNHKYTAKVYLSEGEILISSGDSVEELTQWMYNQAESSFDEINGEIIDNVTQKTIKHFQYTPPE